MKHGLGRLIEFDERSRDYPVRELFWPFKKRKSRTWACGPILNQGNKPACTGFAASGEAAAEPVPVPRVTNAVALQIYARAQQLDPWAGKPHAGSTVLAAMKAGKERGWYKEYRWAFGERDLALAIGYHGPAVLGIPWYEGMSRPDATGRIRISGARLGGHAILCVGYDTKTKLYRLRQSWGPKWGLRGDCLIHQDDVAKLLGREGEACIPVVRAMPS